MKKIHPLTEWAIKKIVTEYKEDIALLIGITGHTTDEDFHGECFDYFVPATDRGYELSQTFIIDGIGHDLYPRSWERLENSSALDDMTIVLTGATILYAKSEEDINRFVALQKKLTDNLNDPAFIYRKALDYLDKALDIYRSFIFEEKGYRAHSEAVYIHQYLSQAVACLNHTCTDSPIFNERQAYDATPESAIYHCPKMLHIPDGFFSYAGQLITTRDVPTLKKLVHKLLCATRAFVLERKPAPPVSSKEINYENLADWYQELSLTWRRIRYFCKHNMIEKAYNDACYLQNELLYVAEEFQIEELNLLDSFIPEDLELLALRSNQLEQIIRNHITEHDVLINEYDTLEAFLAADRKRSAI